MQERKKNVHIKTHYLNLYYVFHLYILVLVSSQSLYLVTLLQLGVQSQRLTETKETTYIDIEIHL